VETTKKLVDPLGMSLVEKTGESEEGMSGASSLDV
jgi:hypothetical protein